ncbi:hypothetical protein [Kitasatospora sp. NPDC094011]
MFSSKVYSFDNVLNAFEITGVVSVAPDAEGASGATSTDSTDTGWSVVSG